MRRSELCLQMAQGADGALSPDRVEGPFHPLWFLPSAVRGVTLKWTWWLKVKQSSTLGRPELGP